MIVRRQDAPLAFASLAAAGTIWGASFVLGKIALLQLSVPHLMLYRFLFASIGFVPLLLYSRPRLDQREWGIVALASVIGVPVQFLTQYEGLSRTTASHAALMIGTLPVLVGIAAFVFLGERLRGTAWLALVASTIGVALIVLKAGGGPAGSTDRPTLFGDLLVLASMFASVVWILISKRLMRRHSPIAVSGVITVVGTVMLMAWVLVRDGAPPTTLPATTWLVVAVLGLVATTACTVLWNWGLAHTEAGRAGAFINLEPVIGALLGVVVLHESLGLIAVLGGVLIIAGALVAGTQPSS